MHRAIRWGHASSEDLIRWRYEPTALFNRPGSIDATGCWSGCVVDDDGVPTAVYSAVAESADDARIALARSDRRLIDWQQRDRGVVGPPQRPGVTEARDPYVFSTAGHRYAIQGAGAPDGEPMILLYGCDDLEHWDELGVLLDHRDPIAREVAPANIWECPNLVRIGDRWVLIISRWQHHELCDSRYLIGDLEPTADGPRFVPSTGGDLDDGSCFYAPQALATPDRVLLWGWARDTGRSEDAITESGWSGALTFPRELSITDGRLISTPAPELIMLRDRALPTDAPVTAAAFEVRATDGVRLQLVDHDQQYCVVDASGPARILVDGSVIEVFSPDRPPATLRAYPRPGSHWSVTGAGQLQLNRLRLPAR